MAGWLCQRIVLAESTSKWWNKLILGELELYNSTIVLIRRNSSISVVWCMWCHCIGITKWFEGEVSLETTLAVAESFAGRMFMHAATCLCQHCGVSHWAWPVMFTQPCWYVFNHWLCQCISAHKMFAFLTFGFALACADLLWKHFVIDLCCPHISYPAWHVI